MIKDIQKHDNASKRQIKPTINIRRDLLSMGYRSIQNSDKLGKPIGYHLFVFDLGTNEFRNYFRGHEDEKLHIFNSDTYEMPRVTIRNTNDFIRWLKYTEMYCHIDVNNYSEFEFLLAEDYFKLLI